jgi:hypothetical protein
VDSLGNGLSFEKKQPKSPWIVQHSGISWNKFQQMKSSAKIQSKIVKSKQFNNEELLRFEYVFASKKSR